jgi:hypothetical protein
MYQQINFMIHTYIWQGKFSFYTHTKKKVEPNYDIHNVRTEEERTYTLPIAISYNLYPRCILHEY